MLRYSGVRDDVKVPFDAPNAVSFFRSETRYEEEERGFVVEWAYLPKWIHHCAQVKWDGTAFRYKTNYSDEWVEKTGTVYGEGDKSWYVRVHLDGRPYFMSRLVAFAYLDDTHDTVGRRLVCHIDARPRGDLPYDSFVNLYWGSPSDNANDDTRAGRAQKGKRRYFRGWRYGADEEDFEIFCFQEEAAKITGVRQPAISAALADDGKRVGAERWRFEWIEMKFEDGEEKRYIGDETRFGRRFVTNLGRTGEVKRVFRFGKEVDVAVEMFYETDENGYRRIGNALGYVSKALLHRIIVETFSLTVIEIKEKETGVPWRGRPGHQLQVDHINGDKLDNRLTNLAIVTPKEHRNKESAVRPVIELDSANKVIQEWDSLTKAASSTNIPYSSIHDACTRRVQKRGRNFAFKEEFYSGSEPTRKLAKRSRYFLQNTV